MVKPVIPIVVAIISILVLVAGILLIVFGAKEKHSGRVAIGSVVLAFGLGGLIWPVWELISPS